MTKTCSLFCKSYVLRFTSHIQTCCRLRKVVAEIREWFYFLPQNLYMCTFYRSKANLFCSRLRNSRVWRDSRVILSNKKLVFAQHAATFTCFKTGLNGGVKKCNIAFEHVLLQFCKKKVPRCCCPFYRSFEGLFEVSMPNDRNARVHESRDDQTLVSGVYVLDTALA